MTQICGNFPLPKGGSVCFTASNPRRFSSAINDAARSRAGLSSVDWTITPVRGRLIGSPNFPLSLISMIPPGVWTMIFPSRRACAISSANISASVLDALNQTLAATEDLKPVTAVPMSRSSFSLNCLHATAASILTRARCSASASFCSCAASFSFKAARSLASPAFCSASAARSSMLAMICPDSCDVRTALRSSPAIPRIRTIRDSLASLCLRWSLLGSDVNSAMHSPTQPSPTTAVEIYPNHSQRPSAVFNDATSQSRRIIADHMKQQARARTLGPTRVQNPGSIVQFPGVRWGKGNRISET